MQIGFIGLGSMGSAMALNLVKAGHDVRAWNRSRVAQESVPGVTLVKFAADAFEADAVFTMLSDDPAIREVILDAGLHVVIERLLFGTQVFRIENEKAHGRSPR
jgi:3-hydroxyisobutyrate dehydrogenase-like beta-hydroxyacid dehydrogenase